MPPETARVALVVDLGAVDADTLAAVHALLDAANGGRVSVVVADRAAEQVVGFAAGHLMVAVATAPEPVTFPIPV